MLSSDDTPDTPPVQQASASAATRKRPLADDTVGVPVSRLVAAVRTVNGRSFFSDSTTGKDLDAIYPYPNNDASKWMGTCRSPAAAVQVLRKMQSQATAALKDENFAKRVAIMAKVYRPLVDGKPTELPVDAFLEVCNRAPDIAELKSLRKGGLKHWDEWFAQDPTAHWTGAVTVEEFVTAKRIRPSGSDSGAPKRKGNWLFFVPGAPDKPVELVVDNVPWNKTLARLEMSAQPVRFEDVNNGFLHHQGGSEHPRNQRARRVADTDLPLRGDCLIVAKSLPTIFSGKDNKEWPHVVRTSYAEHLDDGDLAKLSNNLIPYLNAPEDHVPAKSRRGPSIGQ